MSLKQEIAEALEAFDMDSLLDISRKRHGVFRVLISLAYDREQLLCWRAIEGLGVVAGDTALRDAAPVRNLVGRLLWTIREESGGIGWSSPDMLGEIVRNSPGEFADIAPIIASFHEEDMLRRGVMRALFRISQVRPDLIVPSAALAEHSLDDEDPGVRFYAVMLAGALNLKSLADRIDALKEDRSVVKVYEAGDFRDVVIGNVASETVNLLTENK